MGTEGSSSGDAAGASGGSGRAAVGGSHGRLRGCPGAPPLHTDADGLSGGGSGPPRGEVPPPGRAQAEEEGGGEGRGGGKGEAAAYEARMQELERKVDWNEQLAPEESYAWRMWAGHLPDRKRKKKKRRRKKLPKASSSRSSWGARAARTLNSGLLFSDLGPCCSCSVSGWCLRSSFSSWRSVLSCLCLFRDTTGIVMDTLVTVASELLPSLLMEALLNPKVYLLLMMFMFACSTCPPCSGRSGLLVYGCFETHDWHRDGPRVRVFNVPGASTWRCRLCLSLFASGQTTGIIMDSGDCVPLFREALQRRRTACVLCCVVRAARAP